MMGNLQITLNDLWSAINKFEDIYDFENEFPHVFKTIMIGLLYELELSNTTQNINRLKILVYEGCLAEEIIELLK